MKIVLSVLGVVVVAVAAWFLLMTPTTNDFEVTADEDVAAMEESLAGYMEAIENGSMDGETAVQARAQIESQIASIKANIDASSNVRLTAAQKAQLQDALTRLQQTLIKFNSTLVVIDTAAADADARVLNSGSGNRRSLTAVIADAIADVESTVEEVVDDYVADVEVVNQIEDIVESTPETVQEIISDSDTNESSDEDMADDEDDDGFDPEDESASSSDEYIEAELVSPEAEVELESETTIE